ncbi:hypothetical protein AYY18_10435 [Morganella psychrotolerans]|uniref:Uncharacterized protein n=1 Tax=Morganella psychrotolerans TaxID=368603 RepID=A0A1B8H200_9GAMM|nr:hypothetical protein AYY18_10435 [Morganella psychrotolerans]
MYAPLRVIFQSVAALAALRNPGHILMYAPRISSLAALPQIEIYSVNRLRLWTDKKTGAGFSAGFYL